MYFDLIRMLILTFMNSLNLYPSRSKKSQEFQLTFRVCDAFKLDPKEMPSWGNFVPSEKVWVYNPQKPALVTPCAKTLLGDRRSAPRYYLRTAKIRNLLLEDAKYLLCTTICFKYLFLINNNLAYRDTIELYI